MNTIVLFGGTGNLAYKKLYPALYKLFEKNQMEDDFKIIGIGRKKYDMEDFVEVIKLKVKEFSSSANDEILDKFCKKLSYEELDFDNYDDFIKLKEKLEKENLGENLNLFLATAPEFFPIITENVHKSGLLDLSRDGYKRVVIEKPFGRDLEDAKMINKILCGIFSENEIFRTDHYLGKAMIQNIMVLRFSNGIFEPLWNNKCIDNVQITVSETIGVEERGRYYEKAGAFRDMIQSHLLQVLALFAMEPPKSLDTEDVRDEKVKAIKSLKCFTEKDIINNLVLGQYKPSGEIKGYREETFVDPKSLTETFTAISVELSNERWDGTGFYLRTGKHLKEKAAEIVVQFRGGIYNDIYSRSLGKELQPNLLKIKIQPKEGVSLGFNMKEPNKENQIESKEMDFCQSCVTDYKSPEAYEKLIQDVLRGDQSLFARWDEVEASWAFVDKISKTCLDRKKLIKEYEVGSWGPIESDIMLSRRNLKWWTI